MKVVSLVDASVSVGVQMIHSASFVSIVKSFIIGEEDELD